jgi:hypothetical protein
MIVSFQKLHCVQERRDFIPRLNFISYSKGYKAQQNSMDLPMSVLCILRPRPYGRACTIHPMTADHTNSKDSSSLRKECDGTIAGSASIWSATTATAASEHIQLR